MNRFLFVLFCVCQLLMQACTHKESNKRPNIIFAISDDQSFAHTSFAGCKFIQTPAFDRVANEGVCFTNCIAGSPGCAPSRSSIVTGRQHWQNEQSGQHASSWLKKYVPFIEVLEKNGYATGRTGKGISPFRYARSKSDSLWRKTDAAGIEHSRIVYHSGTTDDNRPAKGISDINYFENYKFFMDSVRGDKPFFFWFGAKEPHRAFEKDSWRRNDKNLKDAKVPGFLPDHKITRGDVLDYAVEIEWFDLHLKRMLMDLEERGELENTIVIVTSDNGMAFPRAKANGYEYGIHVPFAVRFPKCFESGKRINTPVGFADIAPTILELTGIEADGMQPISGKSFLALLNGEEDKKRKYAFSGRERHSSSRYKNRGYPQRMVRSKEYLLIWNMKPERWPAGDPQRIVAGTKDQLWPMYGVDTEGKHHSEWAFTDIDASPSKSFIVENKDIEEYEPYFHWTMGKRPEYELFNIEKDPFCLNNLIGEQEFESTKQKLRNALEKELIRTEDPRISGPDKEIFDSYLRYSRMREFPKSK